MVLPLIAAGIGGAISAFGARSAARTQANAATQAAKIQQKATDKTNAQLGQWRQEDIARMQPYADPRFQNALAFNMGFGDRPDGYAGFQESPGYRFMAEQGDEAVQGSVAARNGLNSGAAMAELQRMRMGLASQEFGNYFSRLQGLATNAQNAALSQGDIGQRYGNAIAGNMLGAGQNAAQGVASAANARAAGTIGAVNGVNNALTQGVGMWQTNRMLNAFAPQANGTPGQGLW